MKADRARHKVCQLEPNRIVLLVGQNRLERQMEAAKVVTATDPSECQF